MRARHASVHSKGAPTWTSLSAHDVLLPCQRGLCFMRPQQIANGDNINVLPHGSTALCTFRSFRQARPLEVRVPTMATCVWPPDSLEAVKYRRMCVIRNGKLRAWMNVGRKQLSRTYRICRTNTPRFSVNGNYGTKRPASRTTRTKSSRRLATSVM